MASLGRILLVLQILAVYYHCVQGRVRVELEGGNEADRGRVVMYWYNIRGTVCNDTFNDTDAAVICRMLGKSTSGAKAMSFGAGTGLVMVSGLTCGGHETHLENCTIARWSPRTHCTHSQDAGVLCEKATTDSTVTEKATSTLPQPQPTTSHSPDSPPLCVSSSFSTKVYGGVPAEPGRWPHMVRVVVTSANGTRDIRCGGSVISRDWIITAAHCLNKFPNEAQKVLIQAGSTDLKDGVRVRGSGYWIHDSHDVGLIRLERPLNFSAYIQPVCLNTLRNMVPTGDCYIAGWGITREGQSSTSALNRTLQTARYPILPDSHCWQYPSYNYDANICAGYANGTITACTGDSGGPLVCRGTHSNQWTLWGVLHGGPRNGCGPPYGYFTVWTEVANFISWIRGTTQV